MNDLGWIDAVLGSARPQVMGALLRYFRDLDTAEEAFQEACLRALKTWPQNGPPRDAAAWLIFVGRNAAMDDVRRRAKQVALPDEAALSNLDDAESELAERLDGAHYRDDILRLLFICCHPELPATQQIALALRIVCGLSVKQIARAFLVGEAAMEQRITRAKARIAEAGVPFEAPGAPERAERLAAVAAMIYLVFNEGYSAPSKEAKTRAILAEEGIWLVRLLLRVFPSEPEVMGLAALMLLQQARAAARFDSDGNIVLLEDQDRSRWSPKRIAEGLALIDKAMRHRRPGPYQVQAAIAALHARARRAEDTDWAQIDLLYANLERLQPSPVVTLNRAVAVNKIRGPAAALAMIEPLDERLASYFYFHGVRGALLQQLDRRAEARKAFDRAISLAHTPAEAAHIRQHLDIWTRNGLRAFFHRKSPRDPCRTPVPSFVLGAGPTTEIDMTAASPPVLGGVAPYLSVSNAGKAADFYKKAFGASEVMRVPPDEKGRYLHIHLVINGGSVMLADAFPDHGHPLETPGAFMLHLQVDDVDAWWKRAVEAGAEVVLPVSEMFWGDRYGQLRDPFGIKWSIATPIRKS